ncbi:hypothetical protein [Streptomyces sp. NPDC017448]|uniref:hypothetical protein n=1 Tax=Streptomyces sp. NPDC017448 TaxID=3364996 RepID=UPI0037BB0481
MDTQQVSAPPPVPSAGVVHVNIRLTDGYTIISNRLSQHRGLSLLAIGLCTHIQSVPDGWRVGIKALAAIFPESEARIAAALRELERHGFLRRVRVRASGGRVTVRTESYNHPEASVRRATASGTVRLVVTGAAPEPAPVPRPVPVPVPQPAPAPAPAHVLVSVPETVPDPADPAPAPAPVPESVRRLVPLPTAPKPPPPPLSRPCEPGAALSGEAVRLLAGLQLSAPGFVLSEADVERLAPGVAAWLERGVRPEAVRAALTDDPPVPLRHPAKLLRHRLIALLPPPLPAVAPLQNCDGCDRAFRSAAPGWCRECREVRAYADERCPTGA